MKQRIFAVLRAIAKSVTNVKAWKRATPYAGMAIIGVAAFFWGRESAVSQTRVKSKYPDLMHVSHKKANKSDYQNRVVAYIYGNIPITREDLGEYLIERFGKQRIEFLINRRIVDMAAKAQGVYVTQSEIEAQLADDLRKFNPPIKLKDFEKYVLQKFNKTLFEWKEDVIRPKLLISKLVRKTIEVTEEDLRQAFEATYGPKVECRMIVLQKHDNHRFTKYEKARKSEEGFAELARNQFIPQLAASGGKVPPIHKHFGDPKIEKEAFSLKVGQCSRLMEMPDGTYVILKCDKHVPADKRARLSEERETLTNRIAEFKLAAEIPKVVQRLRAQAQPKILMQDNVVHQKDLEESARQAIKPRIDKALQQTSGQAPVVDPNAPLPVPPQLAPPVSGSNEPEFVLPPPSQDRDPDLVPSNAPPSLFMPNE